MWSCNCLLKILQGIPFISPAYSASIYRVLNVDWLLRVWVGWLKLWTTLYVSVCISMCMCVHIDCFFFWVEQGPWNSLILIIACDVKSLRNYALQYKGLKREMLHYIFYGRQNSKMTSKSSTPCVILRTVNMIDFSPVIKLTYVA